MNWVVGAPPTVHRRQGTTVLLVWLAWHGAVAVIQQVTRLETAHTICSLLFY